MTDTQTGYSTITRELFIDASPEVVFEVISTPEHVRAWWPDSTEFSPEPGGPGWVAFGDPSEGGVKEQLTVADAVPNRRFSFHWTHEEGEVAGPANSNLVTFDLEPEGTGTRLRFTEIGFTDRGWDAQKAAAIHADHTSGWDHFLPQLVDYAHQVGASR